MSRRNRTRRVASSRAGLPNAWRRTQKKPRPGWSVERSMGAPTRSVSSSAPTLPWAMNEIRSFDPELCPRMAILCARCPVSGVWCLVSGVWCLGAQCLYAQCRCARRTGLVETPASTTQSLLDDTEFARSPRPRHNQAWSVSSASRNPCIPSNAPREGAPRRRVSPNCMDFGQRTCWMEGQLRRGPAAQRASGAERQQRRGATGQTGPTAQTHRFRPQIARN